MSAPEIMLLAQALRMAQYEEHAASASWELLDGPEQDASCIWCDILIASFFMALLGLILLACVM